MPEKYEKRFMRRKVLLATPNYFSPFSTNFKKK